MGDQTIEVDYLIVAAGAVGTALADSLFTEPEATLANVDRRIAAHRGDRMTEPSVPDRLPVAVQ